jgi:hypothetical protein
MYTFYRVYLTPRNGRLTYGDEIEITDEVRFDGLPSVRRSIDSTDYDVGVFKYDDVEIKALNRNGYFNDENDVRSIFPFGRNKAKVRVVFSNTDADTIVFKGLINEEATRLDPENDEITFRVLSLTSVIRNTNVSSGTIPDGTSVQTALASLLDVPTITAVLNYSLANNNPDYDFNIDVGSEFDNRRTSDAVNELLLASNSVMIIDGDDNIIIRNRDEDTTRDVLNLYGPFDIKQRTNITKLISYNTGMHRMFTAVKVNGQEERDAALITDFGYRQKVVALDFITTDSIEVAVAERLLEEFKAPKKELQVEVPTYVVRNAQILDRVSLSYPLRVKPIEDKFLPVIGSTVIGEVDMPLPDTYGSLSISSDIGFKIIEIVEDPQEFTTVLKLRQIGNDISDGLFNNPGSCLIGYARIDESAICGAGEDCDSFEVSAIGAALIGCTLVA